MIERVPPPAAPPSRDLMRAWLRQAETREEEIVWARRYREAVAALFELLEPPGKQTKIPAGALAAPGQARCGGGHHMPCGREVGHDGPCLRPNACAKTMRAGGVCGRRTGHRWECRSVEVLRSDAERRSGKRAA